MEVDFDEEGRRTFREARHKTGNLVLTWAFYVVEGGHKDEQCVCKLCTSTTTWLQLHQQMCR